MANSKISTEYISDKKYNNIYPVSSVLYSDTLNSAKSLAGINANTIDNTELLNNKTEEQIFSNVSAVSLNGISATDLLQTYKIRMLVETQEKQSMPDNMMVAVTYNEDILFWGRNPSSVFFYGIPDPLHGIKEMKNPHRESKIKKIIIARWNVFILYEDGHLYFIGYNEYGVAGLGHNSFVYELTLTATEVTDVESSNSGDYYDYPHALIIKDGKVYASGRNLNGQLGVGDNNDRNIWTPVLFSSTNIEEFNNMNFTQIYPVNSNLGWSFIINEFGEVFGTGYNADYQLGLNDTTNRNRFHKLDIVYVKKLACRGGGISDNTGSTIALKTDGRIWGWGKNNHKELNCGDGSAQASLPFKVPGDIGLGKTYKNIKASLGTRPSFIGLTTDNNIQAAGWFGFFDQAVTWSNLYNGNTLPFTSSTCDQTANNTFLPPIGANSMYIYGYNGYGQCGVGYTSATIGYGAHIEWFHSNIKQVSGSGVGDAYTIYILLENGQVYAAGYNGYKTALPTVTSASVSNYTNFVK